MKLFFNKKGDGKMGAYLFLLIFLLVVGFIFFGDLISQTKGLHDSLIGKNMRQALLNNFKSSEIDTTNIQIQSPITTSTNSVERLINNSWCQSQDILVNSEDKENPVSDKILGWDEIKSCCLRQIGGYNCALGELANVDYCYTSTIGGEIVYVTVNNYFVDTEEYQEFILDQDREYIENKPCDAEKYPATLK